MGGVGWLHYNFAAGSFLAKKLCSKLYSIGIFYCVSSYASAVLAVVILSGRPSVTRVHV